jgi:hypothetical protein
MQFQLVPFQGLAQIQLDLASLVHLAVHGTLIEMIGAAIAGFDGVQCQICGYQQIVCALAVLRPNCYTDADTRADLCLLDGQVARLGA